MARIGTLVVTHDGKKVGAWSITGLLRIGRHPENDIVLDADKVSRFHTAVFPGRDGACVIEDLGSTNGTVVDGERVERSRLGPDMSFCVGPFECSFVPNTDDSDSAAQVIRTRPDTSPMILRREQVQSTGSAARRLSEAITDAAAGNFDVLLLGETGAGKTFAARMIHERSGRAGENFVHVNCGAFVDNLVESELFGIEAGVATGTRRRIGRFQVADRGTLFLDEISKMPLTQQAKLLLAVEQKAIYPVGWEKAEPLRLDVRIIAATNHDPKSAIAEKRLLEDLYFRLRTKMEIRIPPLRERPEEIEGFARQLLDEITKENPDEFMLRLSVAACDALRRQRFPGNLRDLAHFLWNGVRARSRALRVLGDKATANDHLLQPADLELDPGDEVEDKGSPDDGARSAEEVGLQHMQKVLNESGSVAAAAKLLRVAKETLYAKIRDGRLFHPRQTGKH